MKYRLCLQLRLVLHLSKSDAVLRYILLTVFTLRALAIFELGLIRDC
jgi:hypothetical protein